MDFRHSPDRCRGSTFHHTHWCTYTKDHRHSQLERGRGGVGGGGEKREKGGGRGREGGMGERERGK